MDDLKQTYENLFKETANSIREKDGTTTKIKPLDFPDRIRAIEKGIFPQGKANITNTEEVDVSSFSKAQVVDENLKAENIAEGIEVLGITGTLKSGGLEINGNTITCECNEPITAGDFVEYVKEVCVKLETGSSSSYHSSIILDDNKAFIAYKRGSISYLYGMIVEITDTIITCTTTQLVAESYSCISIPSAVLLEPNKVFIVHKYNNHIMYGTIVEINGTEMTATTTQLSEQNTCYYEPSAVRLANNKVFIAHAYYHSSSTARYLYGTIVEINGTEMTATTTQLSSQGVTSCFTTPHTIILAENKVFVAYVVRETWDSSLHGMIAEIQGNEILVMKEKRLNTRLDSTPNALLLESNKILITFKGDSSDYNLYGIIIQIDSSEEMTYTKTQITNDNITCYGKTCPKAITLNNNQVFIVHNRDKDWRYLYGTIIKINETTIEVVSSKKLNDTSSSGGYSTDSNLEALLVGKKVFITHPYNSSYYLSGTIHYPNRVSSVLTTINGVAKTSGAAEETIEVYVPKEAN